MSAQNAGRQSPDPSRQSGAQQQEVPSAGKIVPEFRTKNPDEGQAESERTKTRLTSNPQNRYEKMQGEKEGHGDH